MKKLLAGGLIAGTVFALSLWGAGEAEAESRIATNVEIGKVNVSGMTSSEAEEAIASYANEVGQKRITLKTVDKEITVSAADLGFAADSGDSVDTAVKYGRKGNLIERYQSIKAIDAGKKKSLSLSTTADETKIRDFLKKNQSKLVTEPVDGTLKLENGEFTYVAGKNGHELDMEASVEAVMNYVSSGDYDKTDTVDLVTKVEKPRGTEEELSQVKDVLGKFSTDYSASSAARAQNVQNGASKINGTLLYPGDKFSVAKALNPMTKENGYAPAPSYENGTTVETYGGGICQVSTTLYNAVIRSELKVLTRSAHSMMVHYVQPSEDAAIAGFSKDFQFQNNTDYPVYIDGHASGGIITFTVYGKETRDPDRTVEFESETTDTIKSKTKLVADSSLPVGTITKTDGSVHDGLKARLWKIVKVDGKEKSRTVFNNSSYAAGDAVYSVGTKSDSAEARAAMQSAIASGDLSKAQDAAAKWRNAQSDNEQESEKKETDTKEKKDEKKNESSKKDDKSKTGKNSGKDSKKVSDKTSDSKKK
ncbi:MAG: VanW family protein [Lachnospiraceae bacterium]|nr:VanW family protein [Lachnospiraceae bacterium]